MRKVSKRLKIQMKPAGQEESITNNDLFVTEIPVWYQPNGKVNPKWLSICEEERNQTTALLEQISNPSNLIKAYKQVKKNGGSSGIDGVTIKEFGIWFNINYQTLQTELQQESYRPQMVRGIKIPKPKGGFRILGIPTIKDRVVHQAISQVLQPIFDPKFSTNSYGFRPKHNAHQALLKASEIVKSGKSIIVDLDLAKFFDEVNHQRLLWLLGTRIGDKGLLRLISRIVKTDILIDGLQEQRIKGTPQGSPLSPLLSNIVLDELDQELTRRGLSFVRYADDLQIFVSSQHSANRVQEGVINFIENKMKLKVNREKSGIKHCYEVNFLGHRILYGGKLGLSQSSEQRLKEKLKTITQRKRGVSFEQLIKETRTVLQGWLHYFRLASMKSKLTKIEGWLRRRLKCFRLKQCKRTIGIVRFLRKLGVEKTLSWRTALSGKGWWRLSNSPALSIGMSNQWFIGQGFYSLTENYKRLHCKPL
jgi:group II intron reverse transcriptase/maturase